MILGTWKQRWWSLVYFVLCFGFFLFVYLLVWFSFLPTKGQNGIIKALGIRNSNIYFGERTSYHVVSLDENRNIERQTSGRSPSVQTPLGVCTQKLVLIHSHINKSHVRFLSKITESYRNYSSHPQKYE